MGRSGCSLSWLAVYCQLLISLTAWANALFDIHLGKFNDSHISIWLSAAHAAAPGSRVPQSQLTLSAAGGLLGRTQSSASHSPRLQAPGLGRGKSKPVRLLPSSLHSPQISLTAGLCHAKPLPAPAPLGAQAHHRAARNPTTVSSGPHCEGAMSMAVKELKALTKMHTDAFLTVDSYGF